MGEGEGGGWASSLRGILLPKHQQVLVVVISVTVLVRRVCPCTVCKRHLAFHLCLFLKRGWYRHPSRVLRAPPEGCQAEAVAGGPSPPRTRVVSQQPSPDGRWIQKCSFGGESWKDGQQEFAWRMWGSMKSPGHKMEAAAELRQNTGRSAATAWKINVWWFHQRLLSTRTND